MTNVALVQDSLDNANYDMIGLTGKETMTEKTKVVKPRKKKLSLDFSERNDNIDLMTLGVVDREKVFSYKVVSPVFVTGYNVKDLDNFRRAITAHYSNRENVSFYVADFNGEMKEFSDLIGKLFTKYAKDRDSIYGMLKVFLDDTTSGTKILYLNDGLKLIEGDEELAALVEKAFEVSANNTNIHVYMQSHGNRLTTGDTAIQAKIFKLAKTIVLAGNIFNHELKLIFAEKATSVKMLKKAENAIYVQGKQPEVFEIYKLPVAWFKETSSHP